MTSLGRLFSNASVAILQVIVSGLVMFFLYRYLLQTLGAEQLGLWSIILASTSVARLSDMGLTGSVVKFVAKYRAIDQHQEASNVVETAAVSIAVIMGVLILAVYPFLHLALELFIPSTQLQAGWTILPWAMLSLWLGGVAGVFQSGLDGCQRMDIRNFVLILSNASFLLSAIFLVPLYGLEGVAIGQVIQTLLIVISCWMMLRRYLQLPLLPTSWSRHKFKEMFDYALNFQITSIALLLFEPTTKLLMSRYAGLSSTAYFEMASQFVVRLRALFIVANQALVPAIAELYETAPQKVREIYLSAYNLLSLLVIPFYIGMAVSLPVISLMWIGTENSRFESYGLILIVGWGLNNLIATAYFVNLGTGDPRRNSIPHVAMSILNILLGSSLGYFSPQYGVVLGGMLSLVIGSWWVIYDFHKRHNLSLRLLLPKSHLSILFVTLTYWLAFEFIRFERPHSAPMNWIALVSYLSLVIFALWFHPSRRVLVEKMKSRKTVEQGLVR